MKRKRRFGHLLLLMAALGGLKVTALDIIPIFDASISNDAEGAKIMETIRAAILEYKYRIAEPITVRITFKKDTTIGLGQSTYPKFNYGYPYPSVRTALIAHATSALDAFATASLPNTVTNPVNNGTNVEVNPPLARALGLTTATPPDADGTISLNTPLCKLSPDPKVYPVQPNLDPGYSLYATVCHEMDEVLGFGSRLYHDKTADTTTVDIEDLFRYDQNHHRSFTTDESAQAYFFIPGYNGNQLGRRFNNRNNGGDYGDWDDSGARVQDYAATEARDPRLSDDEMQVFDAIGYTILPTPVWMDLDEICCSDDGSYFWAYRSESRAAENTTSGSTIIIKGNPLLHHSRLDASTYGHPVRLTSFDGNTRIVP